MMVKRGHLAGWEVTVSVSEESEDAAAAFARLATELHERPGVEQTVEAVLQFALQAVGCTHAGVVLARRGGLSGTAAVTDPVVGRPTSCSWNVERVRRSPPSWMAPTVCTSRIPRSISGGRPGR